MNSAPKTNDVLEAILDLVESTNDRQAKKRILIRGKEILQEMENREAAETEAEHQRISASLNDVLVNLVDAIKEVKAGKEELEKDKIKSIDKAIDVLSRV